MSRRKPSLRRTEPPFGARSMRRGSVGETPTGATGTDRALPFQLHCSGSGRSSLYCAPLGLMAVLSPRSVNRSSSARFWTAPVFWHFSGGVWLLNPKSEVVLGGTGYQPVPPGYQPGGRAEAWTCHRLPQSQRTSSSVPRGKLPRGSGWQPVPPSSPRRWRADNVPRSSFPAPMHGQESFSQNRKSRC